MNALLADIKLVATDCDGVLTDGGMYYTESGDSMRRFCVLDGVGFLKLQEHGIVTVIITAEKNDIVKARAKKLGINHLIMGEQNKLLALQRLCDKYGILLNQTVYIGDDLPDIDAIKACGFGCAPPNAISLVKESANYITTSGGGYGCFREIAEMVINAITGNL